MAKAKSKYKPYPQYQTLRVGCKVSWYYYRDEATAKKAAIAARHNADIQWSKGYDFGYQTPGFITKMNDEYSGEWAQYAGLWEVCVP